jgi:hypothetical protein
MEKIKEFLGKNRIILQKSEIDFDEAKRLGKEVYYDGILTSYYLQDGFYTYSAYCSSSRGNFSNAYRISNIVSLLNPDKDIEILFEYMDLLCKEMFDLDTLKVDRSVILKNINKVRDGLYDVSPVVSKYFWVRPYTNIGLPDKEIDGIMYPGKGKVVMNQYNKSRRIETISKIENAIDLITSELANSGRFLTINLISNVSGLAKITIAKNFHLFKEDVDRYNMSVFNTDNYNTFIRSYNIDTIKCAIESFKEELETKITKKKVSNKSKLHINTVYNLWDDEDVQNTLEEYNNWITEYKYK